MIDGKGPSKPTELVIFVGAPTEPDPNQSFLAGALSSDTFRETMEGYQVGVIGTSGWPASAVNLGWIQRKVKGYWKRNPELEVDELLGQIKAELSFVVSRLKYLSVGTREGHLGRSVLDVKIKTKDDHGWYVYEFSIALPVEGRLKVVKEDENGV